MTRTGPGVVRFWTAHADVAGCGPFVTTEVHPLPAPADAPAVGVFARGADGAVASGRAPKRISVASFPSAFPPAPTPVPPSDTESSGVGMRVSMRRMSWTLRFGSWSIIWVSMRYMVASCGECPIQIKRSRLVEGVTHVVRELAPIRWHVRKNLSFLIRSDKAKRRGKPC